MVLVFEGIGSHRRGRNSTSCAVFTEDQRNFKLKSIASATMILDPITVYPTMAALCATVYIVASSTRDSLLYYGLS